MTNSMSISNLNEEGRDDKYGSCSPSVCCGGVSATTAGDCDIYAVLLVFVVLPSVVVAIAEVVLEIGGMLLLREECIIFICVCLIVFIYASLACSI